MGAAVNWLALCAATAVILLAAWQYFRRVQVDRPPVGVFNLRDVAFTFGVLIIIPPLYLDLPAWLVGSILVLTATGLIFLTTRPMFGGRIAIAIAGGLAVGEVVLTTRGYGQSTAFVVLNDIAIALLVVGVCNIWAQSGVRARDVAVFACAVSVFDLVAVWLMPLMLEFFSQVRALPFAPMLAVGTGDAAVVLGLGDLLFVVLWPLVAVKAFGGRAGLVAAAGTLGCVVALAIAFSTNVFTVAVPAMVFVAPVIVVQYLLLRRRHPAERSTGEYRGTVHTGTLPPVPDLTAALAVAESGNRRPARFLAVHHDGTVLGTGSTPGAASRAARAAAPDVTPVLVLDSPWRGP
ncbi:MAG TPA: hypothetical protein VFV67_22350 [Actinophytocola sp.]|uniref:hypothetical protein n=1 Tax=Actinophytocola sp. TaxID=1872138 RepID=UPI002DB91CE6|nr:hypothetical protein [Actinophytocola sp.]HEU5473394.1 hypothetical protein [Actinophytocola sp.]